MKRHSANFRAKVRNKIKEKKEREENVCNIHEKVYVAMSRKLRSGAAKATKRCKTALMEVQNSIGSRAPSRGEHSFPVRCAMVRRTGNKRAAGGKPQWIFSQPF